MRVYQGIQDTCGELMGRAPSEIKSHLSIFKSKENLEELFWKSKIGMKNIEITDLLLFFIAVPRTNVIRQFCPGSQS